MMNSQGDGPSSLKWGVSLMPDLPVAEMARLGAVADEAGFDRCWLFDEGVATRDLYVTLTALALSTTRIHLGPGITNPYTRHPGVTAAAIASLHELSGGRAFLGLGAGGSLTLGPLGIAGDRPATTMRESIQVIRALLDGGPVDFDGSVLRLRHAQLSYGDPDIPLWVAARGPRILATGAELADGVSLDHIHRDFLTEQVGRVRAVAADAGNDVSIAYSATLVVTDADLERVRRHMTYRLVDSPPAVREALGMGDDDVEALRQALADGLDAAARHVRDEWIFPFVIHGTPTECAATILDLVRDNGFSEFTVPIPDPSGAEATMATATDIAKRARQGSNGLRSD